MIKPQEIGGFCLYDSLPNTISPKGALYIKKVYLDIPNNYPERFIRVYLPSCYDYQNPHKRFRVLYMMDGKNLFDKQTAFIDEWEADEIVESFLEEEKEGIIVVGIDAANDDLDRTNEMLIESSDYNEAYHLFGEGYASILGNEIVQKIKPLIDSTFYTRQSSRYTGIGGSSMGGLFAFYMGMKYRDIFGFSLCFSPAFSLYKEKEFQNTLQEKLEKMDRCGKFIFYIGNGDDLEKRLLPLTRYTYVFLQNKWHSHEKVRYLYDEKGHHEEKYWRIYFKKALYFWVGK